ncbi:YncE family protein [Mesonia aestuariivivens]|uniref:Quinoprotein amine dehydrogenase n=1 Tax=Mesonia aestuariivivens TaxID=2796128 RepID=A0ABS6VYL7_9FLAO|nr:quinoprotein amine dehydrogenase [Mesonia aestuariivivens]MBW2960604.1 quinoprotein amine dehydrogenase [Mesonia aestuariivivens]
MKFTKFIVGAFLGSILLSSCSDDDDFTSEIDEPLGAYDNGILVLNEGGIGTVTYISDDLQTSQQSIYQLVNDGDDIGGYAQSIFFDDDLAYIISNGSNLITVVNRYTFEIVGKVDSGLEVPRYGVVYNGKAYVTNQGDTLDGGVDDFLTIINLETLEVEQTIHMGAQGEALEFIEEEDGKLYIQKSTYNLGEKITVFNPTTNEIENTIVTNILVERDPETGEIIKQLGLNSFEIENNAIYTLSGNKLEKFNLNTLALESTITFAYEGDVANIDIEDDQIYFTVANSVYMMSMNAEEAPAEPLFTYNTTSQWGTMYGFEVEDNRIYVAEGGDFVSDSFVEIYDLEGNLLKNITVGVGPNGFYFND